MFKAAEKVVSLLLQSSNGVLKLAGLGARDCRKYFLI